MSVREALGSAMAEEIERDRNVFVIGIKSNQNRKVILIGEEVGQYQGAYKVTKGI